MRSKQDFQDIGPVFANMSYQSEGKPNWLEKALTPERITTMLSWALTFLVIALVAAVLGFGGIAGTAAGIAKILFVVFLVLFIVSILSGRRGPVV